MDRISKLPDELLVKIILYVATKVAVSTSILSKRWESLWMWLPKLEYGHRYSSEHECKRLLCFLDRNLPLHRAPVRESFRLELFNSGFKPENISMWVGNAVSHCVRELYISHEDTDPATSNILLSNLFTCKSLVTLKLVGDILLDVLRMASLPSVKNLELLGVRYLKDGTLQRLISNCTVLEDLVVDLCDYDTTGKLSVLDAYLQNLSIYIPYDHGIHELVIDTPCLKYLKLILHSFNDYYCLIEYMPNLIEAYLDVELLDINIFIGSITSVKRLAICSQTLLDEGFVFNQLEHLEICLCTLLFSNQLFRMLKGSSKLQGLDIFFMDHHVPLGMDEWNQPSTVPECMLSSLQSLNWSMYTGEPQERDIAVYILKYAVHLKTVTIKSSESGDPKFEMLKEFALSSRASPTCQLMFD